LFVVCLLICLFDYLFICSCYTEFNNDNIDELRAKRKLVVRTIDENTLGHHRRDFFMHRKLRLLAEVNKDNIK
jgi:hypothetical protein